MRTIFGLTALLLFAPAVVHAQNAKANSYLPPNTQVYLQWDGGTAQPEAFAKTAWGQTMKGDMGKFHKEFFNYVKTQTISAVTEKQAEFVALTKDAFSAIEKSFHSGFTFGLSVGPGAPVTADVLLVFHGAGGENGALMPLVMAISEKANAQPNRENVGKRVVYSVQAPFAPVYIGWWDEAGDVIFYAGSTEPVAYAKKIEKKETGVANALSKQVASFKDYPTVCRGYVDFSAIWTTAGGFAPQAAQAITGAGLDKLRSMTFVSGYDGKNSRSITEIDAPGPRKGLLSLLSQKPVDLSKLPSLPSKMSSVAIGSTNAANTYKAILETVDGAMRAINPDQADNTKETIKALQAAIGIDLDAELFGSLGELTVTYSGRREGLPATLIQVKDEAKLTKAIDSLLGSIPALPGFEVQVNRTKYEGATILDVKFKTDQATVPVSSLCVHKGWLAYSSYPQGIKGFLLRSSGKLPAWKMDDDMGKLLKAVPSGYTAVSAADTRESMAFFLSTVPIIASSLNSAITQSLPFIQPFDIHMVPNAEEATQLLHPTVSITTDDGRKIRTDSRGP